MTELGILFTLGSKREASKERGSKKRDKSRRREILNQGDKIRN